LGVDADGVGEDRLKADVIGGDDTGLLCAVEGIDRSRRSFMPEARGAGAEGAAGDVKDEKSSNLPVLGFCA
jgi:hypothetical protein